MRDQIMQILKGYPVRVVEQVGPLWKIGVGPYGGSGKDALALARELKAQYDYQQDEAERYHAEPRPVEIPVFLQEPVIDYHADRDGEAMPEIDPRDMEIAALKAALAAKEEAEKNMFDASQLQDLMRENEPYSEAQLRWQSDYNQLTNRIVDPRLPPLSDKERELLNRLQRALYAGRKGAVGMI